MKEITFKIHSYLTDEKDQMAQAQEFVKHNPDNYKNSEIIKIL